MAQEKEVESATDEDGLDLVLGVVVLGQETESHCVDGWEGGQALSVLSNDIL